MLVETCVVCFTWSHMEKREARVQFRTRHGGNYPASTSGLELSPPSSEQRFRAKI